MRKGVIILLSIIIVLLAAGFKFRQTPKSVPIEVTGGLPEGYGISANYPGDIGIENDPNVIFAENFEAATLEEVLSRWTSYSNKNGKVLSLVYDSPSGSAGNKCLEVTATLKNYENTGGYLYKVFEQGYDEVYARFYVKFAEDFQYAHHFVKLFALKNPPPWPIGEAGRTPKGDERFNTGIEPTGKGGEYPPPGIWHFYTYWHEMSGEYGNDFSPKNPVPVKRNEWICVEFMVKANSAPDKADGEQAFWINGELKGRFVGFRWRTTNKLKINTFWLLLYVTYDALRRNGIREYEANPYQTVYFDQIVIATKYIGPIKPLNQTST